MLQSPTGKTLIRRVLQQTARLVSVAKGMFCRHASEIFNNEAATVSSDAVFLWCFVAAFSVRTGVSAADGVARGRVVAMRE
jgi:hypothetical protein